LFVLLALAAASVFGQDVKQIDPAKARINSMPTDQGYSRSLDTVA
jgi:hypothetical protein